jgi:hypothetical protein
MKRFFLLLLFFILVHTSTFSWGLSPLPQDKHNKSDTKSLSKRYKVHFFSLKRGHKITSSYFTLEDHNKLEVKIPGETFLEAKGNYTKNSLQFKASFEGTIIKQKKHYCYTFTITGISLLDTYLAGTMVLNESIKETHQVQEITLLFIGMPEENDTSDDRKRTLFPF